MKYGLIILLCLILLFPLTLPAQTGSSASASSDDTVSLGRRLLQQNCSVCHTQATLTNPMYGPSLYRDILNGKEEAMRE